MLNLFELSPNFNEDQLKDAYKRLILKYHPEKNQRVTSTPMFQMLTQFYRALKENLQERQPAQYNAPSFPPPRPPTAPTTNANNNKRFDVQMFNKLFEQYKITDTQEEGYGDWLEKSSSLKEKSAHATQAFKEPQPYISGADDIACYELGVKKVGDYSAQNNGSLHFTDFRLAHTTDRIVDPTRVQARKEYRTVDDLKVDRANVSHTMSPKEMAEYIRRQQEEAKQEKQRQAFLHQCDGLISRQFDRLSNVQDFSALR